MKALLRSPVFAIMRGEILFNRRRVAPYILLGLFCANAILWWQGASVAYGWATNSDFYIARLYGGFAFLTTPFFVAMLTGDAVSRDFRFELAPLLLSKPIHRAEYLLGKFFGNFVVLTACSFGYALTLFLLQAVRLEAMIVLPFRIVAYLKHFFILVVITQFALAAFCFLVGTLSRNSKLVYLLVTGLYALYIPLMMVLQFYTPRFGKLIDPFLFDWVNANGRNRSAEVVNQMVITYDWQLLGNRLIMLVLGAFCLLIVYRRFTYGENRWSADDRAATTGLLGLAEKTDRLYHEEPSAGAFELAGVATGQFENLPRQTPVRLPQVVLSQQGFAAQLRRLLAATVMEFKLLGGERSLVILIPLTLLMCLAQLAPLSRAAAASPSELSALYAATSSDVLILLLFGVSVFFTGEAVFRDRELRLEAMLWSAPAADGVFLLAKFAAVFMLSCGLVMLGGLTALGVQGYRNFATLELLPYLKIYAIILLPAAAFMSSASLLLSVLSREKYVAYIAGVASGGALFYLFSQGRYGWLYNPLLYQLWQYADLSPAAGNFARILFQRLYWLAIATACLACAHLFFRRPAGRIARRADRRLAIAIAVLATLLAVAAGLFISLGDWRSQS
jgi:ABC-2 type transport system permease protein